MGIPKTGKEKSVIIFFALTLVVIIAMAVIDPKPPNKDEHDHGDDPAQAASLEEKIAQAKERIKSAPNNTHALIYLGDLYLDSNQLKKAMNMFEKVLAIEPTDTHALADMGTIYQMTNLLDKSFEMFKTVEMLEPENLSALYNLGMLNRYHRRDNDEALKYFGKLLLVTDLEPSLKQRISKEIGDIKAEMK